jgi:amidase
MSAEPELVRLSAAEMAEAVRRRQLSARELLEAHAARIEARNGELNAIAVSDLERARAAARAADLAVAAEHPLGPLHGVPFTVKEQLPVAGLPSREASLLFPETFAAHDAPAVARLRTAGGILLGKTNMSELALWPDSVNRVYGATRNPHDPARSAGGSSGGEACAVAAGLSPLGLGGDYGGSIRCPAHFCGVAGLRAGTAAIPAEPAGPLRWGGARDELSTLGLLARGVGDLALGYGVLGAPGAEPTPPKSITLITDSRAHPIAPRCAQAVEAATAAFASAGFPIVETTPPFQTELEAAFDSVTAAETRDALATFLPDRLGDVTPQTARIWTSVEHVRAAPQRTAAARSQLRELAALSEAWLARHPILLAPVATEPAFELGRLDGVFDVFVHCKLASALGLPAVSVPVPGAGLPAGVQLIGRRRHERQLLLVAGLLETALP